MIKQMFLGEDRVATKAYLKLFIEKIVINLPRIDITCKSGVLLAALENKTAARSCDVLAADINWLAGTYSCKNFMTALFMAVEKHKYQTCPNSKY
jgi:hypothetical protein